MLMFFYLFTAVVLFMGADWSFVESVLWFPVLVDKVVKG